MDQENLMPIEHEKRVLWFLKKQKEPLARALIGRKTKINYYDLLDILAKLEGEGHVEKSISGNREYWMIKKIKKKEGAKKNVRKTNQ